MAMHDWNDYRNQILARVGEIGKLAHEHSHAFDAVHACLPRFITLHEQSYAGRPAYGRSPSTTPASRKQNPVASGPTDNLA
jgi:hypothetical protein